MTLMEAFIADAIKRYQEPERRGVSRGTAIGPFKSKFVASLHSLLNHPLKVIADHSGVSYGNLRLLRTDNSFKNLIQSHQDDFAENYLWPFLTEGSKNLFEVFPQRHGYKTLEPISLVDGLSDAESYSPELKTVIASKFMRMVTRFGIKQYLDSSDRLAYLLEKWNAPELNRRILETVIPLGDEMIWSTLQNTDASEDERNAAILCSRLVSRLYLTT